MEAGKKSSTVLVKVRGEEVANRLFRTGLWVGGRWCSVRRFVVIVPQRKEGWRGEVRDLRVRLDGLCRAGERTEDKVVGKIEEMMRLWRKEGEGRRKYQQERTGRGIGWQMTGRSQSGLRERRGRRGGRRRRRRRRGRSGRRGWLGRMRKRTLVWG